MPSVKVEHLSSCVGTFNDTFIESMEQMNDGRDGFAIRGCSVMAVKLTGHLLIPLDENVACNSGDLSAVRLI